MKIHVSSDSGPYAIYNKAQEWGRERDIVEVPDAVYERYDKAYWELDAAREALDEAIDVAQKSANSTPNGVNSV